MNTITSNSPAATPARSQRSKAAVFLSLTAVGVLTAVGFAVKTPGRRATSAPPHLEELTAEQLIRSIPVPDPNAETGRQMAKIIAHARLTPDKAGAWVAMGDVLAQCSRETGDAAYYSHAEAAYRHALKIDARSATAMTGLAWVFGGRHQFLESTEWARRALEIDPANASAYGISGDAALEQGDYDLAFDHYQRMSDLRPDLSSWSRGAYLLWLTGSTNRGLALMQMAIRSGGPFAENTAWCRSRLAIMLLNDGALEPAAQALEPALKSSPENTQVLLAAGRVATAKGDLAAAEVHYQKVLEHGPNLYALAALGDLRAASGDESGAETFYEKVEALHTANVAAGVHDHTMIAKFYADHDRRLDVALKLAQLHAATRNVHEADVLAWVLHKNGDSAGAIQAIKTALSRGTPDPELHFHAGMIAAAAKDLASAKKHLLAALSMNPRFHPLLARIAQRTLDTVSGHEKDAVAVSTGE